MKFFKSILLMFLASVALSSQQPLTDAVVENPIGNQVGLAAPPSDQLQVGHKPIKYITFINTNFPAFDVGCSSEGDICVVGSDRRVYCYDFIEDKWESVPLADEITEVIAIDMDDDGKIYIIAKCGIFLLDCYDKWNKLPGYGIDIGVGVNFDVWKIGSDKHIHDHGVWKLFCECDCNCTCSRICLRFRKHKFIICEPVIKKRCYWFRADIHGKRVDVTPEGDAIVVNEAGHVYRVDGKTFEVNRVIALGRQINAEDCTVSNYGTIYCTDKSGDIFVFDDKRWKKIREAEVNGKRICASALDHIWYTKKTFDDHPGDVYTSAIHDYVKN